MLSSLVISFPNPKLTSIKREGSVDQLWRSVTVSSIQSPTRDIHSGQIHSGDMDNAKTILV